MEKVKILKTKIVKFYPENGKAFDSKEYKLEIKNRGEILIKAYESIENQIKDWKLDKTAKKEILKAIEKEESIELESVSYESIIFETHGWKEYEDSKYMVFSDCAIGKNGIRYDIHTSEDGYYLNPDRISYLEKGDLFMPDKQLRDTLKKVTSYGMDYFYIGIVLNIASMLMVEFEKGNWTQYPIFWIIGEKGCGKTTLVKNTLFIPENKNKEKACFEISMLNRTDKKEITQKKDMLFVIDDVRDLAGTLDGNRQTKQFLESYVRSYSENISNRKMFVVTSEPDQLSNKSESFKSRCMPYPIKLMEKNNGVRIVDNINYAMTKEMQVLFYMFLAYEYEEKEFSDLEVDFKIWSNQYTEYKPRVLRNVYIEYVAGKIFRKILYLFKMNEQAKLWKKKQKKEIENRLFLTNLLNGNPSKLYISYLIDSITKDNKHGNYKLKEIQYNEEPVYHDDQYIRTDRSVNTNTVILFENEILENYIGLYFEHGIEPDKQTGRNKIAVILSSKADDIVRKRFQYEYGDMEFPFSFSAIRETLRKEGILYTTHRSDKKTNYNYRINLKTLIDECYNEKPSEIYAMVLDLSKCNIDKKNIQSVNTERYLKKVILYGNENRQDHHIGKENYKKIKRHIVSN